MRIGIIPVLHPSGGGIYQYSLSMLQALYKQRCNNDEYIIFHRPDESVPGEMSIEREGWIFKPLSPVEFSIQPHLSLSQRSLNLLRRGLGEGPHREVWRSVRRRWSQKATQSGREGDLPDPDVVKSQAERARWFRQCGAELMLYPAPNELSFETGIPYVMAIHDLQHRLQPEFPEVSANGQWEEREYLFRNGARCATLLLADSEVGKEDILEYYGPFGVTEDRVKVLPFIPASYLSVDLPKSERIRVRAAYQLPERYLFYPAQFWPHKNHARIIRALSLLKREHSLTIPIVFCGSYGDEIREQTWRELVSLSGELELAKQVSFLGFLPDEDMSALYAEARALVMPTFFGPTNIPVLEAWGFGCPVLTSDIRGIREQVGDAALLADPRSVEDIAAGILRLWTDDDLHQTLTERGRRRLAAYTADDYAQRLLEIVEEAKARVGSTHESARR
jgi:glycosyltransferase involved in cell wall biosynthesis